MVGAQREAPPRWGHTLPLFDATGSGLTTKGTKLTKGELGLVLVADMCFVVTGCHHGSDASRWDHSNLTS